MRAFACEVGKAKLPERGDRSLFESLQLQLQRATPAKMDVWVPPTSRSPAEGATTRLRRDGRRRRQGERLEGGAVRDAAEGALSSLEGKGCASTATCTVAVRGGDLRARGAVEIGAAHSGITIENYNGEHATVSGGVAFTVPKAAWSPYKQKRWVGLSAGANNVFGQAASKGDTDSIDTSASSTTAECEATAKAGAAGKGPFHSFTFRTPAFGGEFAGRPHRPRGGRRRSPRSTPGRLVVQNTWVASVDGIKALAGVKEFVGLRVDGRRAIRAKYPNGDPEQSGHFLRGAGASMGGGDYVEDGVPLSAGTEWVPPFRKPTRKRL